MVRDMPPLADNCGDDNCCDDCIQNTTLQDDKPSEDAVEVVSHLQDSQGFKKEKTCLSTSAAAAQVDVYCTRKQTSTDVEDGQPTSYNLHQGRPDLDAILLEMKQVAIDRGVSKIAVIGCGPRAMMRKLQQGCLKHSDSLLGCSSENNGVFFDLHTEKFEF